MDKEQEIKIAKKFIEDGYNRAIIQVESGRNCYFLTNGLETIRIDLGIYETIVEENLCLK